MIKCLKATFCCLCLWLPSVELVHQEDETENEIKALIPAATALSAEDFARLTAPGMTPVESESLMFLFMECDPATEDEEKKKEFSYVGGPGTEADPAKLAGMISRGPHKTFVKTDWITEFTCEMQMGSATGTVAFEVPEMIRGSFHYKAAETDDGWQIEEISLPAYGLITRRQKDGKWKRSEMEKENEDG